MTDDRQVYSFEINETVFYYKRLKHKETKSIITKIAQLSKDIEDINEMDAMVKELEFTEDLVKLVYCDRYGNKLTQDYIDNLDSQLLSEVLSQGMTKIIHRKETTTISNEDDAKKQ